MLIFFSALLIRNGQAKTLRKLNVLRKTVFELIYDERPLKTYQY